MICVLNCRKPTYKGDPIDGFNPVHQNEVNFLNITNEGLFLGISPNDKRMDFYDYFVAEVKRLVEVNGDEPKLDLATERFCNKFVENKRKHVERTHPDIL